MTGACGNARWCAGVLAALAIRKGELLSGTSVAHAAMPLRDDNPSEVDLLGFEDVVDVLESIVTRADIELLMPFPVPLVPII